jgi:quercetin dioxygenase-like cupin family protein
MTVGNETEVAEAGTLVWAPADVPHGVDEALERTVMLVGIAPPPGRK